MEASELVPDVRGLVNRHAVRLWFCFRTRSLVVIADASVGRVPRGWASRHLSAGRGGSDLWRCLSSSGLRQSRGLRLEERLCGSAEHRESSRFTRNVG